jgi:hypothetical protein
MLHLLFGLPLAIVAGELDRVSGQGNEADVKEAKRAIALELDRCTLDVDGRTINVLRVFLPKPGKRAEQDLPLQTSLLARRLKLESAKWLDELAVGGKSGENEIILAALASDTGVVLLTGTTNVGHLISYRVTCAKPGEPSPRWSKTFPFTGQVGRPGEALAWPTRTWPKALPQGQPLAWLGENVLVCAGPVQDVLCLEGDTGKERWRVERIWEYQRGFVGPSVWQHVLCRHASDDEKKDGKQGKDEERPPARQHSIIGGPVVVDQIQRIFVAVANGPSEYAEEVSDCVVYEFGFDGEPVAMVNLPRMILGGQYRVQKDGIVWACEGGAFVKLRISPRRNLGEFHMGPGGPDMLCRVDWYRQLSAEESDGWHPMAPANDSVAFGDDFAVRAFAGGYFKVGTYCLPLSMIDLKTGTDRRMLLRVPWAEDSRQTREPHAVAITSLEVEGKRLRITLGMEKWARGVEFPIDELKGPKGK